MVEERLTTFPTCCNTENPNYRPCEPKAGFRNPVRSIGIILPQLSGIVVLHPAGRTRGLVLFSVSAAAGSPSGTHPLKLERYREGSRVRGCAREPFGDTSVKIGTIQRRRPAAPGSPSGTHPLKLERYREGPRVRGCAREPFGDPSVKIGTSRSKISNWRYVEPNVSKMAGTAATTQFVP